VLVEGFQWVMNSYFMSVMMHDAVKMLSRC
jgi:hypothetical protein